MIQRKLVLSAYARQSNEVIKQSLNCFITVEETVDPYSLIFFITAKIPSSANLYQPKSSSSGNTILKMEVFEDDLSKEINAWLNGKEIQNPCYSVNAKVENSMTLFMKSGKTPPQLDLILWILSRSEIQLPSHHSRSSSSSSSNHRQQKARHNSNNDNEWDNDKASIVFGGISDSNSDNDEGDNNHDETDNVVDENDEEDDLNISGLMMNNNSNGNNQINSITDYLKLNSQNASSLKQTLCSNTGSTNANIVNNININNISRVMMRKTMSSVAIPQKQLHLQMNTSFSHTTTASAGIASNPVQHNTTTSFFQKGVNELQQCDKEIRHTLEQRRVALEIERVRQMQHQEKYDKMRQHHTVMGTTGTGTSGQASSSSGVITAVASNFDTTTSTKAQELKLQNDMLKNRQLHELLQLEVKKQKARSQRDHQKYVWSKAPLAFSNLRGQSAKGAYLGQGPLPPTALTSSSSKSVTAINTNNNNNNNTSSSSFSLSKSKQQLSNQLDDVEVAEEKENSNDIALLVIKKAAANVQAYKLDIKQVFDHVCSTGTSATTNNINSNNMDGSDDYDDNNDDNNDEDEYYYEGIVSMNKLPQLFRCLGLRLDKDSIDALIRYFDPDADKNKSNKTLLHREDFLWAFFNRKKLQLQYKQTLKKYANTNQIEQKFQVAYKSAKYNRNKQNTDNIDYSNNNGNDDSQSNGFIKLTKSEYLKLLKSLHLSLTESEADILFDHFDVADDHLFDLVNFQYFICHMTDFTYILNVSGKVHNDDDIKNNERERIKRVPTKRSTSTIKSTSNINNNNNKSNGNVTNENRTIKNSNNNQHNNNNRTANSYGHNHSLSLSPHPTTTTTLRANEKRHSHADDNDAVKSNSKGGGRSSSPTTTSIKKSGGGSNNNRTSTADSYDDKIRMKNKYHNNNNNNDYDNEDDDENNSNLRPFMTNSPDNSSNKNSSLYKAWMARLLVTQHEIEERLIIKHYYLDGDDNTKTRSSSSSSHFLRQPTAVEGDDEAANNTFNNLSSSSTSTTPAAHAKYISKLGYDPSSSYYSQQQQSLLLNSPTYRAHSAKSNNSNNNISYVDFKSSINANNGATAVTPRYLPPLPLSTQYSN